MRRQTDPPDPVTAADMQARWPTDNGASLFASAEILETVERLRAVKARLKADSEEKATLEATIKGYMAEHATLMDDGQVVATWKEKATSRLDTKALTQAHPDIADAFRRATTNRTFLLKS